MDIFRYIEGNYQNGSFTEAAKLLHYDFYWLSHEIKIAPARPTPSICRKNVSLKRRFY